MGERKRGRRQILRWYCQGNHQDVEQCHSDNSCQSQSQGRRERKKDRGKWEEGKVRGRERELAVLSDVRCRTI